MMSAPVYAHFELPENTSGTIKAKCKHCSSTISGNVKTTSNFMTHLKRKHRDAYLSVINKAPTKPSFSENDQPSVASFVKTTTKYSQSDPRQTQITDALLLFVAGNLMPLSIVESQHFRDLVNSLDPRYQVPSRKHLTSKLLHSKSSEVQSSLKQCLRQAQSVCLTIDLWSNRQMKGFLGITGHFILDWTLESVMICCKRFKGKHTADNIRHQYEETMACFDISDKICSIITDNASNMTKAFDVSLPGFVSESKSDEDENEPECDDIDSSECVEESCESFEYLPRHNRCYAHSLQLVVKDGLKDTSQHLKTVIAKVSTIVHYVRRSIHASDILEDERRLQAANATRWNSQLTMIRSVLRVSEDKLNKLDTVHLTTYERKLLQELCSILSPFERATDLVQQDKYVSASLTIPVTRGLKHQLQQLSAVYNSKMLSTLKSSVNTRLSHYEEDDEYVKAAILDPRFKLRWCSPDERLRVETDFTHSASLVQPPSKDTTSSPPPSKAPRVETDSDFFSFMSSPTKVVQSSTGVEAEVRQYLQQPCVDSNSDPLQYWKGQQCNFPVLAMMASKYLAIPASSAPVERLFSIAGKIFRPERCLMTDETFERLMMIKCNHKLIGM